MVPCVPGVAARCVVAARTAIGEHAMLRRTARVVVEYHASVDAERLDYASIATTTDSAVSRAMRCDADELR